VDPDGEFGVLVAIPAIPAFVPAVVGGGFLLGGIGLLCLEYGCSLPSLDDIGGAITAGAGQDRKHFPLPPRQITDDPCPTSHSMASKSDSGVWRDLKPYRGSVKTNGISGKKRRYYEWDHTHNDIEVYDKNGEHLGSIDSVTGEDTKDPVEGRDIKKKL